MKKTFIDELQNDIIPWVENTIIPKQEAHIKDLEAQKHRLLNPKWWERILPAYQLLKGRLVEEVNKLIIHNQTQLAHYQLRLKEYKLHVELNKN